MRKKINTLFVILAMTSVTYGMILKYSPVSVPVSTVEQTLKPQEVSLPQNDFEKFEDNIVNLDALAVDPD